MTSLLRAIRELFFHFFGNWKLYWADLYKPIPYPGEILHCFESVEIWHKGEPEKRQEFIDKVEKLRAENWMLLNFTKNISKAQND